MTKPLLHKVLPCFALCALLNMAMTHLAYAEIHIAIASPLSGGEAVQGEEIRTGANMAIEKINAMGGVLGQQVILDYLDDACNATQATSVANKIVSKPPVAVIGHLCSAATMAAAPIYNEANLPEITFSSNSQITEKGYKNLFRLIGRDDSQAPMLANSISKTLKDNDKIAIIDDKSSWGVGFSDIAEGTFKSTITAPINIAMRDSIAVGQKDFSTLITKLKQNNITHVVLGLLHMEAGLMVRQAREQGFKGQFYGGDPIQTPEFWKIAGEAAEGFQQTGPFDPQSTDKGKVIVASLKKANGSIGIYTFYAYAAVETITQAIAVAGSVKNEAVIKALQDGRYETLLGRVSFDAKGDLNNFKYQMFIWHDGQYSLVQ